MSRWLSTFLIFAFPSSCTFVLSRNISLSLSLTFSTTFMRPLCELCFPSSLSFSVIPSPFLSRFGSYVYFILCFLHPLMATLEPPSPSTSTNILIIPWKPPRLRVLTRSWKTRPSEPPREVPFFPSPTMLLLTSPSSFTLFPAPQGRPSFSPAPITSPS